MFSTPGKRLGGLALAVALVGVAAIPLFWSGRGLAETNGGTAAPTQLNAELGGTGNENGVHHLGSRLVGQQAVFYKSPTCGCCDVYADTLIAAGVDVTVVNDARSMYEAKQRYGIPPAASSCHTFTLGEYVIEGHVPLEALEALLTERPAIDGIVLAGMPIGTPGMPGTKTAPFEVQSLKGGKLTPFMTL